MFGILCSESPQNESAEGIGRGAEGVDALAVDALALRRASWSASSCFRLTVLSHSISESLSTRVSPHPSPSFSTHSKQAGVDFDGSFVIPIGTDFFNPIEGMSRREPRRR